MKLVKIAVVLLIVIVISILSFGIGTVEAASDCSDMKHGEYKCFSSNNILYKCSNGQYQTIKIYNNLDTCKIECQQKAIIDGTTCLTPSTQPGAACTVTGGKECRIVPALTTNGYFKNKGSTGNVLCPSGQLCFFEESRITNCNTCTIFGYIWCSSGNIGYCIDKVSEATCAAGYSEADHKDKCPVTGSSTPPAQIKNCGACKAAGHKWCTSQTNPNNYVGICIESSINCPQDYTKSLYAGCLAETTTGGQTTTPGQTTTAKRSDETTCQWCFRKGEKYCKPLNTGGLTLTLNTRGRCTPLNTQCRAQEEEITNKLSCPEPTCGSLCMQQMFSSAYMYMARGTSTQQLSMPIGQCSKGVPLYLYGSVYGQQSASGFSLMPGRPTGSGPDVGCPAGEECYCMRVNMQQFNQNSAGQSPSPVVPGRTQTTHWKNPKEKKNPPARNFDQYNGVASNGQISAQVDHQLFQAGNKITIQGTVSKLCSTCDGWEYTCEAFKEVPCKQKNTFLGLSLKYEQQDCQAELPDTLYEEGDRSFIRWKQVLNLLFTIYMMTKGSGSSSSGSSSGINPSTLMMMQSMGGTSGSSGFNPAMLMMMSQQGGGSNNQALMLYLMQNLRTTGSVVGDMDDMNDRSNTNAVAAEPLLSTTGMATGNAVYNKYIDKYTLYEDIIKNSIEQSGLRDAIKDSRYNNAEALVASLITQESGSSDPITGGYFFWDTNAVSKCGSVGIMQFTAGTAMLMGLEVGYKKDGKVKLFTNKDEYRKSIGDNSLWIDCDESLCGTTVSPCNYCTKNLYCAYGYDERFIPEKAIPAGIQLLKDEIVRCGSVEGGLGGYNGGESCEAANAGYVNIILNTLYPSWQACFNNDACKNMVCEEPEKFRNNDCVEVTITGLNFRDGAGTGNKVLIQLTQGMKGKIINSRCKGVYNRDWWNVEFNSRQGWVVESSGNDEYLKKCASQSYIDNVVCDVVREDRYMCNSADNAMYKCHASEWSKTTGSRSSYEKCVEECKDLLKGRCIHSLEAAEQNPIITEIDSFTCNRQILGKYACSSTSYIQYRCDGTSWKFADGSSNNYDECRGTCIQLGELCVYYIKPTLTETVVETEVTGAPGVTTLTQPNPTIEDIPYRTGYTEISGITCDDITESKYICRSADHKLYTCDDALWETARPTPFLSQLECRQFCIDIFGNSCLHQTQPTTPPETTTTPLPATTTPDTIDSYECDPTINGKLACDNYALKNCLSGKWYKVDDYFNYAMCKEECNKYKDLCVYYIPTTGIEAGASGTSTGASGTASIGTGTQFPTTQTYLCYRHTDEYDFECTSDCDPLYIWNNYDTEEECKQACINNNWKCKGVTTPPAETQADTVDGHECSPSNSGKLACDNNILKQCIGIKWEVFNDGYFDYTMCVDECKKNKGLCVYYIPPASTGSDCGSEKHGNYFCQLTSTNSKVLYKCNDGQNEMIKPYTNMDTCKADCQQQATAAGTTCTTPPAGTVVVPGTIPGAGVTQAGAVGTDCDKECKSFGYTSGVCQGSCALVDFDTGPYNCADKTNSCCCKGTGTPLPTTCKNCLETTGNVWCTSTKKYSETGACSTYLSGCKTPYSYGFYTCSDSAEGTQTLSPSSGSIVLPPGTCKSKGGTCTSVGADCDGTLQVDEKCPNRLCCVKSASATKKDNTQTIMMLYMILSMILPDPPADHVCYRICGEQYKTDPGRAPICSKMITKAPGSSEVVILYENATYPCTESYCGKWERKDIKIEIINPSGNHIHAATTMTDAYGKFSYTFNAPHIDGEFTAIVSIPGAKTGK